MVDQDATRHAGTLLHISSLPSGKLDDDALRWLDFLAAAGQSVWQVLPLVIPDAGGSPYQSRSAFATDPGMLAERDDPVGQSDFEEYCDRQAYWLNDFALFELLKNRFDRQPWVSWPAPFRHRDPAAMKATLESSASTIEQIKRVQFRLDRAWQRIRRHAADLGIALFGDIPIFIAHDSADTWAQPQDFLLDETGQPTHVTGVPPDYFSETGQRWGNPHYRWERMQDEGFSWWIRRMQRQFELFDMVRIDHFRGLVGVWMIEAECATATDGIWQETPGDALLATLQKEFPNLPIVAEDLGVITDEVRQLRQKYQLPGMAVLQFAFDQFEDNPHKPANITVDTIVYTGTHDNDTCVGWFAGLQAHEKDFVFEVLGVPPSDDIADLMIQTAMHSRSGLAMVPLQDYLALGSEARMNTPGVSEGNWRWRFAWDRLDTQLAERIRMTTENSGRLHAR